MILNKVFVNDLKKFTPIGHRGAGGEIPGNTMESFKHLLDIFPNALIELDVWETSDGKIVIYHDDLLDFETDAKGTICNYAFSELAQIDRAYRITFDNGRSYPFRGKGYKIPLFLKILEEYPDSLLSVDIKRHKIEFARKVISLIREYDAINRVVVGSFNSKLLKYIASEFPEVALSFPRPEIIKFAFLSKVRLTRFYSSKYSVLMIPEVFDSNGEVPEEEYESRGYRLITERFIRDSAKLGIPVFAWTINKKENMKRLLEWGINGIITDYPTRLSEVMSEMEGVP